VVDSGIVLALLDGAGAPWPAGKDGVNAMYGTGGPDTFWLDFTNIALGLVCLICVLAIGAGVVRELVHRLRHGRALHDDHAFETPELGLTMADGGERIDDASPRDGRARQD
jgi:hypothetical protein